MRYGYCRCSTNESRQDITRQFREMSEVKKENIYFEHESGAKTDRIELSRLLDKVSEGDTIVTTEVSRLTRSTQQLCEIITLAKSKKLRLEIGGFIVDCTSELDPMTDGMLKMMGVFAELERNMISQRVKSGMANAREKGSVIGRPKVTVDSLPPMFVKHYPKFKKGSLNVTEFARLCGVTRQTIYKYLEIYK